MIHRLPDGLCFCKFLLFPNSILNTVSLCSLFTETFVRSSPKKSLLKMTAHLKMVCHFLSAGATLRFFIRPFRSSLCCYCGNKHRVQKRKQMRHTCRMQLYPLKDGPDSLIFMNIMLNYSLSHPSGCRNTADSKISPCNYKQKIGVCETPKAA